MGGAKVNAFGRLFLVGNPWKRFRILHLIFLSFLAVVVAVSAEIYTWEDEQGVVHVSDSPPPGAAAGSEATAPAESSQEAAVPPLKERGIGPKFGAPLRQGGEQSGLAENPVFPEAEQAMRKGDGRRVLELLMPLAEGGHPRAQNGVALVLWQGIGVPVDTAAGIQWHLRAAEQGYALAEYYLGLIYADGLGVARDTAEGARWMKKAAEHGLALAQFTLGRMFATGEGVRIDAQQAAEWYLKAAEQGEPRAQHNLAMMHLAGTGVAQDMAQAYRWELRAAEQGDSLAQFGMAYLYAKGEAIPQNFGEATRWILLATGQGHPFALELEPDWTMGHFAEMPGVIVLYEFIRGGENIERWSELFSLHILPVKETPGAYLASLMALREINCPRVTKWNVIRAEDSFVLYEWHAANCMGWPPQHEVALILDRIPKRYQLRYTRKVYDMPLGDRLLWIDRFLEAALTPEPARIGAR